MKIFDISQEILSCNIYPGDPKPQAEQLVSMDQGELYNLSSFSMCAHNGTHIDTARHFLKGGKTVEQIPLEAFVGICFLARHQGDISASDSHHILERSNGVPRLLLAGEATVTAEASRVFANSGICLIGNESQSVGPVDAPMEVHLILLQADVILLEGLVLSGIAEGSYLLSAVPLNLAGFEGSPCRACLIEL